MQKRLAIFVMTTSLLLGGAAHADAGPALESTIKALQDQVKVLSAKVDELESKKAGRHKHHRKGKGHSHRHKHDGSHHAGMKNVRHHEAEVAVKEELDRREKQIPKGYIHLAGINTSLKVGGYVKLDTIYDAGPFTGDSHNLPALPLKGWDMEANRLGHFRMHGRESRITIATLTPTKEIGDIAVFFEGDFFGTTNFSGTSVNRSDGSASSSFNFRVRKAYVDAAGFRIGQDWSTFVDVEAFGGSTMEFNGPAGTSENRQALIRYTHACGSGKSWLLSGAIENSYSEYTDQTGNRVGVNGNLVGSVGDGYQQMPDFVAKIRYAPSWGHIDLRGLVRQISIKNVSASAGGIVRKRSNIGWGVGLSGKIQPTGKSSFYFNLNGGDGIGRYILDLVGQGAAFDTRTGHFVTQFGWGAMAGFEYWFTDQWRGNIAHGCVGTDLARFAPRMPVVNSIAPITRKIDTTYVNLIYKPITNMDIGLEFAHFRRKATGGYKGTGNRVQMGIKYSF